MKVIFLDIDGVLNVISKTRDEYGSEFHLDFVENLKNIIGSTDAKIVISSTWRKSSLTIMKEMWVKRGLPGEVIDTTPSLYCGKGVYFYNEYPYQHPTPKVNNYSIPRGCEIEYWLTNFGGFQRINWSKEHQLEYLDKSKVKNYVILDDDSDMLYSQYEHFVKCSNQWKEPDAVEGYGLTKIAAYKAISILNSNIIDLYYPPCNQ